jgi:cytochrome c oxidase cbb3-type subunit 1
MLLGSWGGIPNSAPVPAWMPTISSVMTVLMIVPLIAIGLNIYAATRKVFPKPYFSDPAPGEDGREEESPTVLKFFSVGLLALLAFTALNAMSAFREGPQWLTFGADVTDLTWFVPAKNFLNTYGFFAMALFGAIYYIFPTLFPGEKLCPKMVKVHFGLAAAGIVLWFAPLALGGIVQGFQLRDGAIPFLDIMKHSLVWLRISTLGTVLLLSGHAAFVLNTGGAAVRFYRARVLKAYADATATVAAAEGRV